LSTLVVCVALVASASAQQPNPTGPLPPGHPPVGAAAPSPPAGVPGEENALIPDSTLAAGDLPAGSIEAKIVDDKDQALAGVEVRLGILRQTVAEGEERTHRTATSGPDGVVRFSGLETGSDHNYRVTVRHEPAGTPRVVQPARRSASACFTRLSRDLGRESRCARHACDRGDQPRDDVFQFQVMFMSSTGRVTGCRTTSHRSPRGLEGVQPGESMSDARFVGEEERVKLLGTFSPGQQEVSFTFQVPNDHDENVDFRIGMPPHVAEVRVIAEAARGMGLEVPGFDPAESSPSPSGQRVLVTAKRLRAGEQPMQELKLRLTGVPTPGPGRMVAAVLAALAALIGIFGAATQPGSSDRKAVERDQEQARSLLLSELVALEKAHRAGEVGPRTYESTRRTLLDALARLDTLHPVRQGRRKSTALATAAPR
jgi:hypothetical protein